MRVVTLLVALLPAVTVMAEELTPFLTLEEDLVKRSPLDLLRRQSCSSNGYATCGSRCMPMGANCCNSNGVYCDAGTRCDTNGCCPIGKTCSGSAGTIPVRLTYTTSYGGGGGSTPTTRGGSGGGGSGGGNSPSITRSSPTSSISCPAGRQVCRDQCILAEFKCCPDNVFYCAATEQCVLTGATRYGCTTLAGGAATSAGLGVVTGIVNSRNGGNFPTMGAGQIWAAGAVVAGAVIM